jgi:L-alanine-DL-glutamate epimerase-like enolase superfamily enzyme
VDWTVNETLYNAQALKNLGVEFLEQPLATDSNWDGHSQQSVLPIIADESCIIETDVLECHQTYFHGVNVKLMKCDGITHCKKND